jgi:hypothetical protein
MDSRRLTRLMMSPPTKASQNPSTWKPRFRRPETHAVIINIRALMTNRKSPSVSIRNGSVNSVSSGLTLAITPQRSQRAMRMKILF